MAQHALSMPVSHHVARREAGLSLKRAAAAGDTWNVLLTEVLEPACARFRVGERLSSADYAGIVRMARETLASVGPVRLEEDARLPTRTRPKGEQHEFRAVTRLGVDKAHFTLYGLSSVRLYVDRKRVELEYDMLGLDVTGHLLERTMQRDLAAWTGRFNEVDDALIDAAGLVVAWRMAAMTDRVRSPLMALPLGDGLMLGMLTPSTVDNISRRVTVNRIGNFTKDMGRSEFHALEVEGMEDVRYLRAAFATAVGDDRLTIRQVDLRDSLRRFSAENAEALGRIGRAATWRTSALSTISTTGELGPEVVALTDRLAALLNDPEHDKALTKGREHLFEDEPEPGPLRPGR